MVCLLCRGSGKFGSGKCPECGGSGFANVAEDDPVERIDPDDPAEIERRGRVALHHGKPRDACPFADGDPRRERWLAGHDNATRRYRYDFPPAKEAGFRAFRDGLRVNECPYNWRKDSKSAAEWREGYEHARQAKERDDTERYR
jgi:ribosome modulation factor